MGLMLSLSGVLCLGNAPSLAGEMASEIRQLKRDSKRPALTVAEWTERIAQALVTITDVRVEETEAGLLVMLETADGTLAEPTQSVAGDALVLEIPNAMLAGEGFEEFAPGEGISLVQVSPLAGDRVQV
ncbi:MAG: TonB-dependent siderophore receptor, partial [Cyanobacteria bacterium P01_D01_bin.105]